MFKKMMLIVILCGVMVSLNALTEAEKQEIFEGGKKEFLAILDSIITKGKLIESEKESDQSAIQAFGGDPRQILIFYKYMIYGDKITQRKGIDGLIIWYGNQKRVERFKKDSIFVKYKPIIIQSLYQFLDDEYASLQVSSARNLMLIGIQDQLVINKLKYYSNETDSKEWNLEYTYTYAFSTIEIYKERGQNAYHRKRNAINEIIRIANEGLKIENNEQKKRKDKTKESSILIKPTILRDLDWEGDSSASYCFLYYGPTSSNYNPAYTNYASQGGDCANFAFQCLIEGYYEEFKDFLSSIQAKLCEA